MCCSAEDERDPERRGNFLKKRKKKITPQLEKILTTVADRLSGDDQLLDLAGAFVDSEQADVAVEPLDAVIGNIAGAAEYLDGAVGDSADRLARKIFGGSGFEGDRPALVFQLGGFE